MYRLRAVSEVLDRPVLCRIVNPFGSHSSVTRPQKLDCIIPKRLSKKYFCPLNAGKKELLVNLRDTQTDSNLLNLASSNHWGSFCSKSTPLPMSHGVEEPSMMIFINIVLAARNRNKNQLVLNTTMKRNYL